MKPLMRLMLVVASVTLLPALVFAGPAAAAKGGNKATVQQCKASVLTEAAFSNLGQCVRGANRATAPGPEPDINIGNQALLLTDNTIFLNDIDYICPADDKGTTILASVKQGSTVGFGTSSATCDGASHTAAVDVGPGPFANGVEAIAAAQLNLPGGVVGPRQSKTVTPRPPDPAQIDVKNHALLLTDGSVVLTVSYQCVPGPGGTTAGMLSTGVIQGSNVSEITNAPAICDDRSHTVSTGNKGPQPFSEGHALSSAVVEDSTGISLSGGGDITISSSGAAHALASR
jgi:hypothetical protein